MKSITFFTTSLTSGGAEHQLCILASFLAEKGYDVCITTYSDSVDHYVYDNRIKRKRLARYKAKSIKIVSIFTYFLRVKTDVVVGFVSLNNFLALLPLLFRPKIKYIAGERCMWFTSIPWYEKINMRLLYRRASSIIPNSFSQAKQIIEFNPSLKDKVTIITNYTDINEYIVKSQKGVHKTIRIAIFSRYERQKNLLRFMDALDILRKKTYKPFMIDWYGNKNLPNESQKQYMFEVLEKYSKLGLQDVMHLNDKVSNVSELISNYDALALPSIAEGFSNSISEYICCGKPVLASDVSDNHVMVHDGVNGYLFDPLDENEIANAFLKFFDTTHSQREQMSKKSREIAETIFDKNKFINSYIEIIERP